MTRPIGRQMAKKADDDLKHTEYSKITKFSVVAAFQSMLDAAKIQK